MKNKQLFNLARKNYSSKKFQTNFDYHFDWLFKSVLTNKSSITKLFLGLNTGIFLYSWMSPFSKNRYESQSNVSFSASNYNKRDYLNLFCSIVGSRRLEDFIFDTTILATLGTYLEKRHGSPFMFKMMIFAFYMSFCTSIFWVKSDLAKRERYRLEDPLKRNANIGATEEYKFSSAHGLSMSLVYYFILKRYGFLMTIPVITADLIVYGPYFMSGILNGLAWGIIV